MTKRLLLLIVFFILILPVAPILADTDSLLPIYAGNGNAGLENGSNFSASFNMPMGLLVDEKGSVIVVDTNNNSIRKISKNIVTTIVGKSENIDMYGDPLAGYIDGTTEKAIFNRPRYAVYDSKGNMYISDSGNHVIRKISSGKVTTFAGTGKAGYQDGLAKTALFNLPSGLVVDSKDNIYVSDTLNNVIRKITPQGKVSTFAGKQTEHGGYRDNSLSQALFNEPSDLAIDSSGNLIILDSGNQLIRKISGDNVTTLAGKKSILLSGTSYFQGGYKNGNALEASFNFPKGIDIAEDDTIFIADTWNHRIRAISPLGKVYTVVGNGVPGNNEDDIYSASLNGPLDIVYHNEKLYISDMWNNCIRVMDLDLKKIEENSEKIASIDGLDLENVENNEIPVYVDKKKVEFSDVKAILSEGKTMVPLRKICEEWGAQVNWLDKEKKVEVKKGNWTKILTYYEDPLEIVKGRTMVHLRFLGESMNFEVEWIPNYKTVIITTKG